MPSVLFLCPHCEKHAEVQVTSVTRSRPCPYCGEAVLLQMGTKDNRRRALLVGAPELAPGVVDKPLTPAYEPQTLEGEVFERMKMDPELRAFRNKLLTGVAVMVGLIIITVVMNVWLTPAPVERRGMMVTGLVKTEEGGELVLGSPEPTTAPVSPTEAAQITVRKFFAAQSADVWLELVDEPQKWAAAIKRHVLIKPLKPLPVLGVTVEQAGKAGGVMSVHATLLGGDKAEVHVLWKGQKALVDWPSFAGWSALGWDELIAQAPIQAVTVRVLAAQAERYEGEFADSGSLICVKLMDPLRSDSLPLFGYATRSSKEGQRVKALLGQSPSTVTKLMLAVRYPANPASKDQVWIDQVVAEGWYQPVPAETAQVSGSSL
jgi:hypothetical protein